MRMTSVVTRWPRAVAALAVLAMLGGTLACEGNVRRSRGDDGSRRGEAESAFIEVRLLEALLLNRPPSCADKDLRVQVVSGLQQAMTTVANPQFGPEADALRVEIGRMFDDGRFSTLLMGVIESTPFQKMRTEATVTASN